MIASPAPPSSPAAPRLLDRVRWHLRVKRYSIRTEKAYLDWIRRFILFHKKRHPLEMGEEEIAAFLSHPCGKPQGQRLNAESGSVCFALPLSASA
jgi:hypothetical protein